MLKLWTVVLILMLSIVQFSFAQTVPPVDTRTPAASVYNQVNKSIFTIYGIDSVNKKGVALGSAIAIGNHVLATNCHIALAGDYLLVKVDKQPKVGQLFYYNKRDDLCLLVVPNAKFIPVKIRPSKQVEIGEEVFAIGNPVRFEKTISKGIISNKFERNGLTMLQTDAPISVGSSGGGLFDINANLIGITTKKARRGESIGFAIPTELILAVIHPNQQDKFLAPTELTKTTTKNIIRTEPSKESIIKYYGDKKIALAKWKRSCVITFTGIDEKKQPKSLIIWLPSVPNGFFIFPAIHDFNAAINVLNEYIGNGYPSLKSTDYFLILNKERYQLRGDKKIDKDFPILILGRRESFTEKLRSSDNITIELADKSNILFDLTSFKDVLTEYQSLCSEQ